MTQNNPELESPKGWFDALPRDKTLEAIRNVNPGDIKAGTVDPAFLRSRVTDLEDSELITPEEAEAARQHIQKITPKAKSQRP